MIEQPQIGKKESKDEYATLLDHHRMSQGFCDTQAKRAAYAAMDGQIRSLYGVRSHTRLCSSLAEWQQNYHNGLELLDQFWGHRDILDTIKFMVQSCVTILLAAKSADEIIGGPSSRGGTGVTGSKWLEFLQEEVALLEEKRQIPGAIGLFRECQEIVNTIKFDS